MNTPQSISSPSLAGTAVTLSSSAYSFFGTSLVIVQWFAAAIAIIAGTCTIIHLIKTWASRK